jgi:hypothetical protein
MELPVMGDTEVPKTESMVQFLLYRVGNSKIEKKYSERFKTAQDRPQGYRFNDFCDLSI